MMERRSNIADRILEVNGEVFSGVKGVSVSKVISCCCKEFDKEGVAKSTSEKHFDDEASKYFHKTPEEILAMWEELSDRSKMYGRLLDEYAEACLGGDASKQAAWKLDHNAGEGIDEKVDNAVKGMDQFLSDMEKLGQFAYVGRELPLWWRCGDAVVNGRCDCLLVHKVSDIPVIVDWKTNARIDTENRFKKMLGPCYMLDDCSLAHYSIQVGMYRAALADTYGLGSFDKVPAYIVQVGALDDKTGKLYKVWKPMAEVTHGLLEKVAGFALKKVSLT